VVYEDDLGLGVAVFEGMGDVVKGDAGGGDAGVGTHFEKHWIALWI